MSKIVAIKLTKVLLDIAPTVCVVVSKSLLVVLNAVIQNLLGHYISWVSKYDLF